MLLQLTIHIDTFLERLFKIIEKRADISHAIGHLFLIHAEFLTI